jgi:uncharacterized membrane protein
VIYGGAAYKVFLWLHLLSVVVGFGPWMLNGLMPQWALKRTPDEGRLINDALYRVTNVSQYAIYAVFVFGFATLGAATKVGGKAPISVGDTWVWVSILLWVAIVGVMHGLALPTQRKLRDGEGDRAALTRTWSMAAGIINLLMVVVVILMIQEPGR